MDISSILNTRTASKSPAPNKVANAESVRDADPLPPPSPTYAREHVTQRPGISQRSSYEGQPRPSSSYSNHAMPLEPTPPLDRNQQPFSPGLERYHHGSKSPEQQRRESMSNPPDLAATLAPIRSLDHLNEPVFQGEPQRDQITPILESAQNRMSYSNQPVHYAKRAREADHDNSTDYSASTPQIKNEPVSTPIESPNTGVADNLDTETARAIIAASNEHGTRGIRAKPSVEQPQSDVAPTKKSAPAKASTKKGIARKPQAKRRKIETEDDGGEGSRRSSTPLKASKPGRPAKSHSNTPRLGSSPGPQDQASSPNAASENAEDEDSENASEVDDGEVYCVCRKPDNHSWMIACDGGCEDWFHGKCVKIQENQGELIDKYICPNCEANGKGLTTWKPCCRRVGCNKPARTEAGKKGSQSKYCSEECGLLFMKQKMGLKTSERNKTRPQTISVAHNDDVYQASRGGVLRPGEVKALAIGAKDVETFRQMGDGIPSPPDTASPEAIGAEKAMVTGNSEHEVLQNQPALLSKTFGIRLTPQELQRMSKLSDEHEILTIRKGLIKDRETFLRIVIDHVSTYAEKEGIKPKDVCGYDSRLGWVEAEFARWRDSSAGQEVLAAKSLDSSPEETNKGDSSDDRDVPMHDHDTSNGSPSEYTFCTRKRCEQHKQWQKVQLNDIKAEHQDCSNDLARVLQERDDIQEQAAIRYRAETAGGPTNGTNTASMEGWTEVV